MLVQQIEYLVKRFHDEQPRTLLRTGCSQLDQVSITADAEELVAELAGAVTSSSSTTGASISQLTSREAEIIAALISRDLEEYVALYETGKYSPYVYKDIRRAFSAPRSVGCADIKSAILWKYGHLGKPRYPKHHALIIKDVQKLWPRFLETTATAAPEAMAEFWRRELDRPRAFVTIAFLVHLLHQRTLPIIDQHNYRAVNYYMTKVRPSWVSKRMPRQMTDLLLVAGFIKSVRSVWPSPRRPSARSLDKYLMMFGKHLRLKADLDRWRGARGADYQIGG
jgi:hypothetical protein